MATIVNLTCKRCNVEFSTKKGKERLFCSKKCKSENRREIDSKYYIEKPCEYCNNLFVSKRKENKKFCSYKCSGLNKKLVSHETRNCFECGKTFSERIKYERNFCSEKCRRKWQTKPENILIRINKTKETVIKKYGVEHTFQIDSIRLKALENLRKTYKERGSEITKNALLNVENNRRKKLINRFSDIGYTILEFNGENIKVSHPDGHIFENNRKLLVSRLNHNVELSTIIQPIGSPRTTFEIKIANFLKNNNIEYIPNDRKIIDLELDIYIPSHKLAIEVNGLHWHSEYYYNNDYHLNKTKMCDELNIQLLHFFEDELLENYNIVESIIADQLNIINSKILIENCIIREITIDLSSEFLKSNHIEGNIKSSLNIGLFYNNELVSIMTFKKLRNNKYEILRFCNKLNTNVIGSTSKLYSYFKSTHKPSKVIVSTNRQYNNCDLYKVLGFELNNITRPNYYYVVGKQRKHKKLYRKDILVKQGFDINKTEHEIMTIRNIPRIYDCGNYEFIDHCN